MACLNSFLNYFSELILKLLTPPWRKKEIIFQMDAVGVQSAPVILFSISFAAVVTILEYAYHMKLVIQTASMVPGFAALLVLRELGSVITALLLTSRVGAGIAAELGSMKITEQIEALRLLQLDPMRLLVIPRVIATIFSSMALTIFANATCLFFSMVVSVKQFGYSTGTFLTAMNRFTSFKDVLLSLVKAGVFGFVIPVVSCYYGLNCKAGAQGVGRATTKAVVTSAMCIIALDFVLTWLFSYLY